ncbi:MAG: FadR family transcriptional regulator [Lachnospiraceae bacterium]|nr:FadR family transcriptional regulator [Lachnospiraceae bacterium]
MVNKVERKSVSDAVQDEVKRLITSGEWKAGTKIPSENELAAMMGVSRVSVRSALQRLSSLGLVESRQGGGTFVCELDGSQNLNTLVPFAMLSGENQKYMVEFRRIIESEAAYLVAVRSTEEDIRQFWEQWERYKRSEGRNSMSEESIELDLEFHLMLLRSTRNPMFTQLGNILKDTIMENIRYAWKQTKNNKGVSSHEQIISAIEKHDPAAARSAMWDHMDIVWDLVSRGEGKES